MRSSDWPARYEIRIEGIWDDRWSDWFGLEVSNEGGETSLIPGFLVAGLGLRRVRRYWAPRLPGLIEEWDRVGGATAPPGSSIMELPDRDNGLWLIWLIDLPELGDGSRLATLSEMRFRP